MTPPPQGAGAREAQNTAQKLLAFKACKAAKARVEELRQKRFQTEIILGAEQNNVPPTVMANVGHDHGRAPLCHRPGAHERL